MRNALAAQSIGLRLRGTTVTNPAPICANAEKTLHAWRSSGYHAVSPDHSRMWSNANAATPRDA
jgi:hypothetical protein